MRTEIEREAQKPLNTAKALEASQHRQERIRGLGLSDGDMASVQRHWQEERAKSTPEQVELIRAERKLLAFDKEWKDYLDSLCLETRMYERFRHDSEREPLAKRVKELRAAAKDSFIHPEHRNKQNPAQILRKSLETDTKHLERVTNRIMGLEKSKADKMALAANPSNATRIVRWHDERIKPLKATQTKLADQVQSSRAELDRLRYQQKKGSPDQAPKQPAISSGKTLEAVTGILKRRGIRFLVSTAIGPGMTASAIAAGIGKMLEEKKVAKTLDPSKIDDLRKGIDALCQSGELEAKRLSHWQGREGRLAAQMEIAKNNPEKQTISPATREAGERAERVGGLINRSEGIAREAKLNIPSNLEPVRGQLELLDSRLKAMGLPGLSRPGLDGFSLRGMEASLADDPALKTLSKAGYQWVQMPPSVVEAAFGKLKALGMILGFGLGRSM